MITALFALGVASLATGCLGDTAGAISGDVTDPADAAVDAGPGDTLVHDVDGETPDVSAEVVPDTDTGSAVQCSGGAAISFPDFNGACATDADCAAVVHQTDCCGNQSVIGIPTSSVPAFDAAEATCRSQYPGCGCPSGPLTAEDGRAAWSPDDFQAVCAEGTCRAVAKVSGCASAMECGWSWYCDFPNDDCGVWGTMGSCEPRPTVCGGGGVGVCTCEGSRYLNGCEAASSGGDVMRFGGCGAPGQSGFGCGEETCSAAQFCSIAFNDVAGPGEPEFYDSCVDLPASCSGGALPSCACLQLDPLEACWDAQGAIIRFYPGG